MAALDSFLLDLESQETGIGLEGTAGPLQQGPGTLPASTDMAAVWRFKAQQQQKQHQRETEEEEEDAYSTATTSPGCSFSADMEVALASSLLELADDACSVAHQEETAAADAARKRLKLPDGTALVATTFWDDLAAQGSLFEFCVRW